MTVEVAVVVDKNAGRSEILHFDEVGIEEFTLVSRDESNEIPQEKFDRITADIAEKLKDCSVPGGESCGYAWTVEKRNINCIHKPKAEQPESE